MLQENFSPVRSLVIDAGKRQHGGIVARRSARCDLVPTPLMTGFSVSHPRSWSRSTKRLPMIPRNGGFRPRDPLSLPAPGASRPAPRARWRRPRSNSQHLSTEQRYLQSATRLRSFHPCADLDVLERNWLVDCEQALVSVRSRLDCSIAAPALAFLSRMTAQSGVDLRAP